MKVTPYRMLVPIFSVFLAAAETVVHILVLHLTRTAALRAEVLFLRQQLALYAARDVQP